jgi:uncharacterized protein YoxC
MIKEENSTAVEMFEGLKDEISGIKKNTETVKSAVDGLKELINSQFDRITPTPDVIETRRKIVQTFDGNIRITKASVDSGCKDIKEQLKGLQETVDKKSGNSLFGRISQMSCATGITVYVEFILLMAVVMIFSIIGMWHWKSVAEQNEDNAMKYRCIRAHGVASSHDIEWLDSIYLLHDQRVIDRIENKVDFFENLSKQKADSIIHKMDRNKQMIN